MDKFKLVSPFSPTGDQPQAISRLVDGVKKAIKSRRLWVSPAQVRHLQWQIL